MISDIMSKSVPATTSQFSTRVIRLIEVEGQHARERAIEDILDVLEVRFDLREAHPLSARIAAIEDLQRLKQLHRAAIQVSSLEAFQHLLDE